MSWLQQLVGKLKSVFGAKSAPEQAATEAGTTPRAEVADAPTTATPTEDTTEKAVAEAPAEPLKDAPTLGSDAPAPEPTESPAEPAEAATAAEPAAAAAEPAVAAAEPAVAEPAPPAEAVDEVVPVADSVAVEPVAETPLAVDSVADAAPIPVEESAPAEANDSVATATPEVSDPAISTLDVEGITADLNAGPYGPGSGKPAGDGSAPSTDFTVKGKESSKLFHTEKSPYFTRTKADVWFKSEADAEGAGFQAWDHKKRAGAKK
ncbi:hypothetical protein [Actinophytocola sp.]|uniref:sunset domain-containing protein n=1 Tax=Actinophytocola sp. TaxID=1872138 RepID=UPI002D592295|nr:hypothetical protein [Actinophytocola sp.]HYQ62281.1 hypothetical protein [Actinophytocola sp.]